MGQIKVEKNVGGIEGLCVIEPAVHGDARGYFMETYNEKDMKEAGISNARCFTDVQTATARDLFDVASSDILDKFISSLVNKCRIHNVISFRGWHSEWNSGLQVHYSFLFSFLFSVLKIGFVHFIHDAVHILRGQLSAGK